MINISLTQFNVYDQGKLKQKFGYMIKDTEGFGLRGTICVDRYESIEKLTNNVNIDTIRDIIEAEHYDIYLRLREEKTFKFNGKTLVL